MSTDCVELFNEAERFLAHRYSKYPRRKTLGKFEPKTPQGYKVRCLGLIESLTRARNIPALPMTQNAYLCRLSNGSWPLHRQIANHRDQM